MRNSSSANSSPGRPSLVIERFTDVHALEKARRDWERVYASDSSAEIFSSWGWLRPYLEVNNRSPLVLAARPEHESGYVAFLPLAARNTTRGRLPFKELVPAGNPAADYCGMITLENWTEDAIAAFARHLESCRWDALVLENIGDERFLRVADKLAEARFSFGSMGRIACPQLELPDNWEAYLCDYVGGRTRKHLRRAMRQLEALPGYRFTVSNIDNFERHLDALVTLHQQRWPQDDAWGRRMLSSVLRSMLQRDEAWLGVIWDGEIAVAALAAFLDRRRAKFCYYQSGFNADYSRLSPGRVIVAFSIRAAIERGFRIFDFLRGSEQYKYDLGAKDHFLSHVRLERNGVRSAMFAAASRAGVAVRRVWAAPPVALVRRAATATRIGAILACRAVLTTRAHNAAPPGVQITPLEPNCYNEVATAPAFCSLGFDHLLNRRSSSEVPFVLLARNARGPVGTVWSTFVPTYSSELDRHVQPFVQSAYIHHLQVLTSFQGRGIATALLSTLAEVLANRGCQQVCWIVWRSNLSSRRAFEKVFQVRSETAYVIRTPFGKKTIAPGAKAETKIFLGLR
jgi:CelD/BcsL family acetyltransferase involved in cellulose biosynthesis/ribosomal protein S18 acetylase RimI-like enzyme